MAKLPPLQVDQDAHNEKQEILFRNCRHTDIQFSPDRHELRCKCGASYTGERLNELYKLLTKNT